MTASAIFVTAFWSIPIALAGIFKLLLPIPAVWRYISRFADAMMWGWCSSLSIIVRLNFGMKWQVAGLEKLSKENWYLLISNHRSWTDIVVLCVLLRNYIPMNKYFLKQQLAWVPFLGLACWALDMPFMRRYSRSYLLKHPELRGKDIETTQRSCEKFRLHPTTIVNFVEGSRYTPEKCRQLRSPYRNLLPPKAAGIAFTLSALGKQFDRVLNVTLFYPENEDKPFMALLSGRMKRVIVDIETIPITDDMYGDYFADKQFKRQFLLWLTQLWQQKDELIDRVKQRHI